MYDVKTVQNASAFFDECVAFFPFKIVLTDNGLEITNKCLKNKKGIPCQKPSQFTQILTKNTTEHRLTLPAQPQTNGMVERVNHTIKSATMTSYKYTSVEDMKQALDDYLRYDNLQRKHGRLLKQTACRTPFDASKKPDQNQPHLFFKNPNAMKEKLLRLCPQFNQQRV